MMLEKVTTNIDALVVGAGPVGLTMAAELARHGLTCRLIDKCAEPSDKSKALVLWSRSLEMLDAMGTAAPFVEAGLRVHGASIYSRGERLLRVSLQVESPFDYALMIPQSETERLLAVHASRCGIETERSVELTTFAADACGVTSTMRLANGADEQVRSAWLMGCDGAHSTVRHTLGINFTGEAELSDWLLADVHIGGSLPTDEISIYFHREGVLALFPIVGGRFRIIADLGTSQHASRPTDPSLADVQTIVDGRGPGGLVLRDPVWLAGFRINERKVADYRHGRVFLAGDAAHIHSPAGGQGMNTGMQDAFNLAWKLALVHHGNASDVLLDSYASERGKVGDQVLRNAGIMTKAATLRNPLAQGFRDGLYRLFGSLQVVQHAISGTLTELSINYRHSPISGEHQRSPLAHFWGGRGGVAAGDRAPDAPLVNATSGQTLQLFDLLRGTRHVLLLLSGIEAESGMRSLAEIQAAACAQYPNLLSVYIVALRGTPGVTHFDSDLSLHNRYGAGLSALYLIRPDGYVGFRSQPANGDALIAHLAKYLL
ncbi:MAG TPA: FAD-dependent monooxygenase [Pirellulales bacterium]|jgi:2-polyprenyl-6-methoxyphenol hydroxylase-like FAD-dependent oxidoreductase